MSVDLFEVEESVVQFYNGAGREHSALFPSLVLLGWNFVKILQAHSDLEIRLTDKNSSCLEIRIVPADMFYQQLILLL